MMMLIIVEASSDVSTFEQVTTVPFPFSPSLVALTIRLDTRGRLFCDEVLAKVNMVEFTHIS